jgi:hypothetical protein
MSKFPLSSGLVPSKSQPGFRYFKEPTTLSPHQQSLCRCRLHVAARSPIYNPYAVCYASVGSTPDTIYSCTPYLDFYEIPMEELDAYAQKEKKNLQAAGFTFPNKNNKAYFWSLADMLTQWQDMKYRTSNASTKPQKTLK